jgi:predicted GIY-YIG superfamily endonuclease
MIKLGNHLKRCIYVGIFEDNYAYVGLTYNYNKRINEHINKSNSPIYKHIQESNLHPKFEQLTDYVNVDIASNKLEEFFKTYYENSGYKMLNINKTGAIGGSKISKYTKEICQKEALKYNIKSQ